MADGWGERSAVLGEREHLCSVLIGEADEFREQRCRLSGDAVFSPRTYVSCLALDASKPPVGDSLIALLGGKVYMRTPLNNLKKIFGGGPRRVKDYAEVESFVCTCGETFGQPLAWRGFCDRCNRNWDMETRKNIKSIRFWDELSPEELKRRRRSLPRRMRHLLDKIDDV